MEAALAFRPCAAIVASPATDHLLVTQALIMNGTSVLVEKPFAHRLNGLPALVAVARAKSLPLFVAYNLRFHPIVRRVKHLLEEHAVGRVLTVRADVGQYLPDWRPGANYKIGVSSQRQLGGGALLELSHELDYVSWLFGRPSSLYAAGGQIGDLEIDVEDAVALTLRYPEASPIVSINLDFLQRAANRQLRIVGTEGTLCADLMTGELDLYSASTGTWNRELFKLADSNLLYLDEVQAFFSVVKGGQSTLLASGQEAIDVLCQVEAAKQSMAKHKEVTINYV
jgi:predicted dehydrogenase